MKDAHITIESISYRILYIRFRGSYTAFRKEANKMVNRLFDFGYASDLIDPNFTKVLTIYNDNPYITKEDNLRTSVAITVPMDAKIEVPDDMCEIMIEGRFGVGHFDINRKEYDMAWKYMVSEWLTHHTPRDSAPFELYVTQPPRNAKDTSLTDIYIPIED